MQSQNSIGTHFKLKLIILIHNMYPNELHFCQDFLSLEGSKMN